MAGDIREIDMTKATSLDGKKVRLVGDDGKGYWMEKDTFISVVGGLLTIKNYYKKASINFRGSSTNGEKVYKLLSLGPDTGCINVNIECFSAISSTVTYAHLVGSFLLYKYSDGNIKLYNNIKLVSGQIQNNLAFSYVKNGNSIDIYASISEGLCSASALNDSYNWDTLDANVHNELVSEIPAGAQSINIESV